MKAAKKTDQEPDFQVRNPDGTFFKAWLPDQKKIFSQSNPQREAWIQEIAEKLKRDDIKFES